MAQPRLLVIDGHSMAFRAFYALPVDSMQTTTGLATNAVYGFTSMLLRLLPAEAPTHVAVAFDLPGGTFRTEQLPSYKGTRSATPPEFEPQIAMVEQVLGAMRIAVVSKPGFEADDVIATLTTAATREGWEVLIVSGDRDTFQLVTDSVTVLYPIKGVSEMSRMTPPAVEAKYGVAPGNYPDLAALVGESSDNLPGVPGVGPKTAAKWLTQFGTLNALLDHAGTITGKAGENLRAHADQVRINRRINHLVTELDLPVTLDDLAVSGFDRDDVNRVCIDLQFGPAMRERILAADPTPEPAAVAPLENGSSAVVGTDVAAFLAARHGLTGLDVVGVASPTRPDGWALGASDGRVGLAADLTELDPAAEQALAAWLASDEPKVLHNAKAAAHMLAARGLSLGGVVLDTELAAYLCWPDRRGYDLTDLAEQMLHRSIATPGAQATLDLGDGPDAEAAADRATALVDLAAVFDGELADRGATGLLTDLELPLQRVLTAMESTGIAVDIDQLTDLEKRFAAEMDAAAESAFAAIGRQVNLGSPKQLQDVLFDQLGMPKTKKLKTGYTTDATAIAWLFEQTQHPFLAHLLAYRDAAKLRVTVEGLLRSVGDDGRIHTTYQQTIAATGRLSSTDPNLQNVPNRTDVGRLIRAAFVVGDGYETLLAADYSQIEMRIMAHLSEDAELIAAFNSGEDLHRFVASRVFGVGVDEVTPAQRSKIKAMTFGLAYGLSSFGLSQQLGITRGEADSLIEGYFQRFGKVRDYLRAVVDEARRTGYTATIFGRRRYLPDLTSTDRQRRDMAERIALNSPIQGSAADIIKFAMVALHDGLAATGLKSRILLQVHDELVLEVAPGEAAVVEDLLRTTMGAAADLSVPLDVVVGRGRNWLDAGH